MLRCGVCAESGPPPGRFPENPPVGRVSGADEATEARGPVDADDVPDGGVDPRGWADADGDEPGISRPAAGLGSSGGSTAAADRAPGTADPDVAGTGPGAPGAAGDSDPAARVDG